ncbi:MAG: twin-arginine translocation signal domain-containing protein [Planctomycetota bacterium]|jgi:arylsulfatase A-like enzyme
MQNVGSDIDRRDFLKAVGITTASLAVGGCLAESMNFAGKSEGEKPNILFCISDDQCWLHAGAYGDKVVKTPNFDRVAREGVLFTHAFCTAPSCSPSRAGILTGQEMWRLEEGGILYSTLDKKYQVYPDILEKEGYAIGFTGKGWSPGSIKAGGRKRNPAGPAYNAFKC